MWPVCTTCVHYNVKVIEYRQRISRQVPAAVECGGLVGGPSVRSFDRCPRQRDAEAVECHSELRAVSRDV